jgi:hypothetical protein
MSLPRTITVRRPVAGAPSVARVKAAVARIVRRHAMSADLLAVVFGSCIDDVFAGRVDALAGADVLDLQPRAANVHALATWLGGVCEVMEMENQDAAALRVDIDSIAEECALIATAKCFTE